jgi:putative FmdB family regulatory protein
MPVYEYECTECNNIEEVWEDRFFPHRDDIICKKCKGKMKKIISRTTFQLKGSGWYKDGYDKGGKKT